MSRTQHLFCRDCREYLWIGQGTERIHIYTSDEHIALLEAFLSKHFGPKHLLWFGDSEEQDQGNWQYTNFAPDPAYEETPNPQHDPVKYVFDLI